MAGFSDVKDGMIDQFKRRMAHAGLTAEMIELVAKDESLMLANGHVSLALAQRWLKPIEVRLPDPYTKVVAIPGVKVTYIGRSGYPGSYKRQWYGDPSDTKEGIFSLHAEYREDMQRASEAPFEPFDMIEDKWNPFIPNWEVTLVSLLPHRFLVRRIPRPRFWVEMAPGWEARFTKNRSFELRPQAL